MLKKEDLGIGDIKVYQDDELYTFTSDSVLLAKFANVKPNDNVADFCAGSGIVGFYLYALNKEKIKNLTFFEVQSSLFELCQKSIKENGLEDNASAINTRLQDIDKSYNERFSLIVCNPPYMKVGQGQQKSGEGIAICTSEVLLKLDELCLSLSRCLKFGGRVCLVHRADRLVEVIYSLKQRGIEPKRLQFVSAKDKQPYLFLLEGVKGGKSGLKILNQIEN